MPWPFDGTISTLDSLKNVLHAYFIKFFSYQYVCITPNILFTLSQINSEYVF